MKILEILERILDEWDKLKGSERQEFAVQLAEEVLDQLEGKVPIRNLEREEIVARAIFLIGVSKPEQLQNKWASIAWHHATPEEWRELREYFGNFMEERNAHRNGTRTSRNLDTSKSYVN